MIRVIAAFFVILLSGCVTVECPERPAQQLRVPAIMVPQHQPICVEPDCGIGTTPPGAGMFGAQPPPIHPEVDVCDEPSEDGFYPDGRAGCPGVAKPIEDALK